MLLLVASKHSFAIVQGPVLVLFDESPPVDRNQCHDALYKLSEWFLCGCVSYGNGFMFYREYKASFITVISFEIYFCYSLDQHLF